MRLSIGEVEKNFRNSSAFLKDFDVTQKDEVKFLRFIDSIYNALLDRAVNVFREKSQDNRSNAFLYKVLTKDAYLTSYRDGTLFFKYPIWIDKLSYKLLQLPLEDLKNAWKQQNYEVLSKKFDNTEYKYIAGKN